MKSQKEVGARSCVRVITVCACLPFFAAIAGAQSSETSNGSMTVGPGTLNYQMVTTSGTCGQYQDGQYTTYEFQNFSFVAPGVNQALDGDWSSTKVTGDDDRTCPPVGLQGQTPPFNLTGSSAYTITITSIGLSNFTASYSGSFAALSAGSLTFATQDIGTTSAPQNITLSNTGTTDLLMSSVSTAGANSGDFAIQSNNCGTVAAGTSCTISVVFTPTATGTRSASLTVSDNSPNSPQMASLSGSGVEGTSIQLPAQSISSGAHTYTAADTLSAGAGSGGFVIGGSASVIFEAGNEIVLQPGFQATAGTAPITFHAFINSGGGGSQFTISGHVTSYTGPLTGVAITLGGSASGLVNTDVNGNYSFTVTAGESYTVTPSLSGYTFSPGSVPFYPLNSNGVANFYGTIPGGPGSQPNPTKEFIRLNGQVVAIENK